MVFHQFMVLASLVVVHGERRLEKHDVKPHGALVTTYNGGSWRSGRSMNESQTRLMTAEPAEVPAATGANQMKTKRQIKRFVEEFVKRPWPICRQLVILMIGNEPRHLTAQVNMYNVLRSDYDIQEECIFVATYTVIAPEQLTKFKPPPQRLLLGQLVGPFFEELSKLDRNGKPLFGNVFIAYSGHGSPNSIHVHRKGMEKKEFLLHLKVLHRMSASIFIILDCCFSGSMFIEDHEQILSNQAQLYLSTIKLGTSDVADAKTFNELFARYDNLENIVHDKMAVLTTIANFVKLGRDENFDSQLGLSLQQYAEVMDIVKCFYTETMQPSIKPKCSLQKLEDLMKEKKKKIPASDTGKIFGGRYSIAYWRMKMERIMEGLWGEDANKATDWFFLLAIVRSVVGALKPKEQPTDLVKKLRIFAVTSTVACSTSIGQRLCGSMTKFLREHAKKEKSMKDPTIQDMYNDLRAGNLAEWQTSDGDCSVTSEEPYGYFDPATGDFHNPIYLTEGMVPACMPVGFGNFNGTQSCAEFFPPRSR